MIPFLGTRPFVGNLFEALASKSYVPEAPPVVEVSDIKTTFEFIPLIDFHEYMYMGMKY